MDRDNKTGILYMLRSKYARSFIARYKWGYLVGIAILFVIDVVQTRVPIIVGDTIDAIQDGIATGDFLRSMAFALAIIAISVMLGRFAWRWFIFGNSRKIERDMRNDMFAHLETLSAPWFQRHKSGEVMALMTNDIEAVRMVFAQSVMMILDAVTIGTMTVINMVTYVDPKLTAIAIIPLVLIGLNTLILGKHMFRRFTLRQEAFSNVADFVQERLWGIKVIKAFVQEQAEQRNFDKVNIESRKANIAETKLQAFMFPFMQMVSGLSMAIAIGYGGVMTVNGGITVGEFSAFLQYLGMLVWPIASMGMIINLITRGSASLKRIEQMLDAPAEVHDDENVKGNITHLDGNIVFDNLTFTYPGSEKPVLENINFTVGKGETVGIVGRTGAGKTTLVNLIMRVYDPERTQLSVGGHDVRTVPLNTLRKTVGYVPQDNFLFSDTITNNIAFGRPHSTEQEVHEAAKAACVHDNIVDFTLGYDTVVGERGVSLSGGQKQRISIARALIGRHEILIMDDAVSAVDTDTEEKIIGHLKTRRAGKTNIIIAHRISTLQHADKIIVLEQGQVAEQGTHEQLLEQDGIYASMYHRQLLEKMHTEELAHE